MAKEAAATTRARVAVLVKSRTKPVTATPKKRPVRQKFVVHHLRDQDFKSDGLRTYAQYRDLGIKAATNGQAIAHVIRFVPPCDPKVVSKEHYHDIEFQMVYVLKGWLKTEFEGQGSHVMKRGSAWLQPPGIKHKVLDYSEDCEVLEIVLPADFKTVELE